MLNYACRTPTPILSTDRRLVALLAGHPESNDWSSVEEKAANALEQARRQCTVPLKKRRHRRGQFFALRCGVSHGGGQKAPGNLRNTVRNTKIVKKLNAMDCFQRFAGFSTGKLRIFPCESDP